MVSIPNNPNNFFRSKDKPNSLGYPGEPISENQHGGRSSGGQIKIRRVIKENILENSVFSLGNDRKCFRKIT